VATLAGCAARVKPYLAAAPAAELEGSAAGSWVAGKGRLYDWFLMSRAVSSHGGPFPPQRSQRGQKVKKGQARCQTGTQGGGPAGARSRCSFLKLRRSRPLGASVLKRGVVPRPCGRDGLESPRGAGDGPDGKARGLGGSLRTVADRAARRRTAGWLHTGTGPPKRGVRRSGCIPHGRRVCATDNATSRRGGLIGHGRFSWAARRFTEGWLRDHKVANELESPRWRGQRALPGLQVGVSRRGGSATTRSRWSWSPHG
jgi:hypothetical protein